jgi:hypothetical protein
MTIGAVNAQMSPVVLEYLLPVASIALLANALIWINLVIRENSTGVGIVAGDAGRGKMFGVK